MIIEKKWHGVEVLRLTMEAVAHLVTRPSGLKVAEYGPLVFALPIDVEYCKREYERAGVERKYPYCDYELKPQSAWNYGFAEKTLTVEELPINATPFASSNPPVILRAQMAPVKWEWADGYDTVPEVKPVSNKAIGAAEEMVLVPYGCAKLRMTEMPKVRT